MVNVALFVRLEAKPGKEADVEKFLRAGLPIVQEEPATTVWSHFGWDRRPSPSTTRFRMNRDGKHTFRAGCCRVDGEGFRAFCAATHDRKG